ncbi:hypothetical protein M8J76_015465 [Diaphorina citri]|nr:hypothetical protein M8J75_007283 [Diaphorina citri]KAI5745912.1 hypothetical protein M8J76_015465 [Diaphorina citri]KAI5753012.1 hypothetical protein M8J77_022703 [Diaphorina citri]
MTDTDAVCTQAVVEKVKSLVPDIQHIESVIPGCGKGNNYMSFVYRICVRFEKSKDLQWLFVKVRPKDESQVTEWADFQIAFGNECAAYGHLKELELPMPKCILENPDIIVLEDLTNEGYTMLDKAQGFNLAQTEAVLKKMARFHSNSIRLRKENPNSFETLCSRFQSLIPNFDKMPKDSEFYDKMVESIGEVEYDEIKVLLSGYKDGKLYDNVKQFLTLNKRNEDHELLGIIHGDCWINNVMLKVSEDDQDEKKDVKGSGSKIDVKFVDLQGIDANSVLVDLVTFLVTSIDFQVLIDHYPHLLHLYHKHLNLPHLELFRKLEKYKEFALPLFLYRALPTRSVTKEEYANNFRLFARFLRKYNFL